MGVTKLRLTGGEPLLWKGTPELMKYAYNLPGIHSVHLTTNGILLKKLIPAILHEKFKGVNVSLDSLKPDRFEQITHRSYFDRVWESIEMALAMDLKVKINMVVQRGINDDEIQSFAELARTKPLDIRFIEEMPFNGSKQKKRILKGDEIIKVLTSIYSAAKFEYTGESTVQIARIQGFFGSIGVINGFSRSFCSCCNRVRITSRGALKTCLYGRDEIDLCSLIRENATDAEIRAKIESVFYGRFANGREAWNNSDQHKYASMSMIGG